MYYYYPGYWPYSPEYPYYYYYGYPHHFANHIQDYPHNQDDLNLYNIYSYPPNNDTSPYDSEQIENQNGYYSPTFLEQVQQLEERLRLLEEKNELLLNQSEDLKNQVDQIKPINIENINYKIQELVVPNLNGTLSIGMLALTDPNEIQKWINSAENNGEEIKLNDIEHHSKNIPAEEEKEK